MDLTIGERLVKYGFERDKVFIDLKQLKEIVKNGENANTEFKLKANHPEKIVKEIVAFANTEGGKLLVGIDDDLQIKGLKFAEEEEFLLVRAIEKFCFPAIKYSIKNAILPNSREVLVFDIPKSINKPHFVNLDPKNSDKIAYVRVKDKSLKASKEVRKYLKSENDNSNVQFSYGEKESKLMQYLEDNKSITVKDFSKIAKIPIWLASKTLVLLALANVLKIIPGESTDAFIRNFNQ
ncbi:MAG: ATP-binding protein [Bacteroidota bacterium]